MNSVRDFGAVGNGQDDDSKAIQHALEMGTGEIVFPRGDYRITRPILIDLNRLNRTSINGLGGLAKLIMAGPGPAISIVGTHLKNADPKNFEPVVWERERFPNIEGIEIEGAHPQADGIHIQGAMQATLSRVAIRGVRTAVRLHNKTRNVLIDACHFFQNTGIGVHFDHVNLHQCIISASHISYCRLGGIRIEGGEVRNLQITGNDIEYNNARAHQDAFPDALAEPTAEIYIDVQEGSVQEGTICSNTIQATVSPNGSNIRLIGSPKADDKFGLWTISGNLISNQESNIHLTHAWGVNITGNQIYGATRRNILLESSRNIVVGANMIGHTLAFNARGLASGVRLQNSHDCLISGMQLQDSQTRSDSAPAVFPEGREALLELISCRRLNVTGCQVLGGTPIGLIMENCEDTALQNCQIFDQETSSPMTVGIDLRGEQKNVVIGNCQIRGATEQAIRGTPQTGVTLTNNVTV